MLNGALQRHDGASRSRQNALYPSYTPETVVGSIDLERRDGDVGWVSHNGLSTRIEYAADGGVERLSTTDTLQLDYLMDRSGRTVGIDDGAGEQRYSYTGGRFSAARTASGEYRFNYDEVGNRTSVLMRDSNGFLSVSRYTYGSNATGDARNNRLVSTRRFGVDGAEVQRRYLKGGQPAAVGRLRYTYDSERRPVQVEMDGQLLAEYAYNGLGERVKKTVHSKGEQPAVTYFLYGGGGRLVGEADAAGTMTSQYLYLEDHRAVAKLEGNAIFAIHGDALGTPRRMTDETGRIVWSASYSPFGRAMLEMAEHRLALRFPGQYADDETGTHYNLHRDYDPSIGRYLSADPLGIADHVNPYLYAGLDPVGQSDPLGLFAVGDSIDPRDMERLNGRPLEIKRFVEEQLQTFQDRENFYYWVRSTLNGTDGVRQTDWFLAAAQVNENDSLGGTDNFGSGFVLNGATTDYLQSAGLELAEQNVQTLLLLYFNQSIAGVDCGIDSEFYLEGDDLDLALVGYEQSELSRITDDYFAHERPEVRSDVMDDLNDLMNYRGFGGFVAGIDGFGDQNTELVIKTLFPDGDFDIENELHRIILGEALVKVNNGVPWE